jgi:protein-L-isoaspartate(D-aspartate) O-methyltransferase
MSELNVDQARYNMIEQQVRTWDVLDQQVLDVLATTPRERFVPERYRNLAFADVEIPIGYGEVMMTPKVEGRLLQALAVQDTDRALEIGTGSGYLTACLAKLAASVVTVELEQELSQAAHQRLAGLELENVEYRIGDAADGWIEDGRFEVIAVTGSVPVLPEGFKQQLTVGGRLFIIVGDKPVMEALLVTRVNEREWTTESLFETELPPLKNASRPAQFVF